MKYYLLLIVLFIVAPANAQTPSENILGTYYPAKLFSPDFVSSKKIKDVILIYQSKPENMRIVDKGLEETLKFDEKGFISSKTIRQLDFVSQKTEQRALYFYFKKNNLSTIRTYKDDIYSTVYYQQDSAGNYTRLIRCTEENLNTDPTLFKLGKQEVKSTEEFNYKYFSPTQFKKFYLNDIGKIYQEEVVTLNKAGKIVSTFGQYVITSVTSGSDYKYTTSGQLTEEVYYSNTGNEYQEKYTYDYKNNQLDTEKKFVNNQLKYERFYFYRNDGIPESILTKYPDNSIDITKISVGFY